MSQPTAQMTCCGVANDPGLCIYSGFYGPANTGNCPGTSNEELQQRGTNSHARSPTSSFTTLRTHPFSVSASARGSSSYTAQVPTATSAPHATALPAPTRRTVMSQRAVAATTPTSVTSPVRSDRATPDSALGRTVRATLVVRCGGFVLLRCRVEVNATLGDCWWSGVHVLQASLFDNSPSNSSFLCSLSLSLSLSLPSLSLCIQATMAPRARARRAAMIPSHATSLPPPPLRLRAPSQAPHRRPSPRR